MSCLDRKASLSFPPIGDRRFRRYSSRVKRFLLTTVVAIFVLMHSASAESIQYYLERVAIHARLVQSELSESPESINVSGLLRSDLQRLVDDIEQWKSAPGDRDLSNEVRGGLDGYRQVLMVSASTAGLDTKQTSALNQLYSELEQASVAIAGGLERETRGNLGLQPARSSNIGPWGAYGPWGGFAGPWGPGCDPWGPYFGRPLNPGSCPYYW